MNIADMIFPAFAPYIDKVAYEIYIAGCDRYCPACHNPELHDFSLGVKFNISDKASKKLLKNIKKAQELFDIIAILGGDLLCQDEHEARRFVIWLKNHFPQKKLWLFTGVNAEELPNWTKEMFDVIKVGRYVKKLHQEGFPASSNQKLLWRGVDY